MRGLESQPFGRLDDGGRAPHALSTRGRRPAWSPLVTIARRILAIMLALQVTSAWALPAGVLCVADDGHLVELPIDSEEIIVRKLP